MDDKRYTLTLDDVVKAHYDDLDQACDEMVYHVARGAESGTVWRGSERLISMQATSEYYAEVRPRVKTIAYKATLDYARVSDPDNILHGLLVEVLCDAPTTVYRLPDGGLHAASEPNTKVVRIVSGDVIVPLSDGGTVRTRYAAVPSAYLEPTQ